MSISPSPDVSYIPFSLSLSCSSPSYRPLFLLGKPAAACCHSSDSVSVLCTRTIPYGHFCGEKLIPRQICWIHRFRSDLLFFAFYLLISASIRLNFCSLFYLLFVSYSIVLLSMLTLSLFFTLSLSLLHSNSLLYHLSLSIPLFFFSLSHPLSLSFISLSLSVSLSDTLCSSLSVSLSSCWQSLFPFLWDYIPPIINFP